MQDDERRDLAWSIAEDALACSKTQRRRFVEDACGDDADLRRMVATFIEQPDDDSSEKTRPAEQELPRDSTSLDETVARELGDEDSEVSYELDPDEKEIGGYRIVQKLGEGGFGVVYQAIQEEPFRRDVAIKILKPGMDSKQVIARFEAERQALALMDHSSIAKVFDAGTTGRGRPYFVMELARGISMTRFCDQERLSIRDRVQLMIEVCSAIQHAHHKGVIHRDIKPSNILVVPGDKQPKPVVIDFGVAKATQQRLSSGTIATQINQIIGTPLYMSPEQADVGGLDVDTRADVYSLGAVLYELISGSRPFTKSQMTSVPAYAISRFLRETKVRLPSTHFSEANEVTKKAADRRATDVKAVRNEIRGDLDWIVIKAMDPDRSRRYATANGLGSDLQRYLNDEPVTAHRPSAIYSLQKFSRRHRGPVIAGIVAVASMAIALVVSLTMYFMALARAEQLQRLADASEVELLDQQFHGLLQTPIAEKRRTIDQWLSRIRLAASHLEDHRDALGKIGAVHESERTPESDLHVDALPEKDALSEKADAEFYHQKLDGLVRTLDRMTAPGGEIEQVTRWQQMFPSTEEIRAGWDEFIADVATKHPDWKISRIDWLYPMGRNPQTGLWEFADLQLGLGPLSDGEGTYRMTADSGLVYVLLPGGTFMMGSPETEENRKSDEHLHPVTLSPFLISKYEVTRAQWKRVGRSLRMPRSPESGPNVPVTGVSWFDCQTFGRETHSRLPTEAEWEYACRGGTTGPFGGTGVMREMGWYIENSDGKLRPVGTRRANDFGIHDMHGNASEWCQDRYEDDFYIQFGNDEPLSDPLNPVDYAERTEGVSESCLAVLRGGTCSIVAKYCRSADRFRELQDIDTPVVGFRVCLAEPMITISDDD